MRTNQARTMAAYNRWMNDRLYTVCDRRFDAERKKERGPLFHSIHGTLNHLIVERRRTDDELVAWVDLLTDEALQAPFEFQSFLNRKPRRWSTPVT